jgi:hypothetical protein
MTVIFLFYSRNHDREKYFLKGLSHEMDGGHSRSVLGLNKGRGKFINFIS